MMWLSTRGYRVVGVELNELACRRFFVENNLKFTEYEHGGFRVFQSDSIQLYCGDFFLCTRDLVGKIGAIYDRAALVALPPAMRERYAEHIRALSCEGVQILLLSVAYDQMQMNGPPFSVSEDEIKRLFVPRFEIERLYYKVACEVPPHFKAKGLITLREAVYRLF